MGDTVDLDQVVAPLGRGDDREAAPADRETAPGPPHPLEVDDGLDVVELDLIPARPDAPDRDPAGLPTVPELDLVPDLGVGLRATATRPGEERGAIERGLQLAGVDGGGDEGDIGQPGRQVLVGRGEPVEPRRVHGAGAHLRPLEEVEEERLVRGAAAHEHRGLRQRPVQASERFVTVAPLGDDLGDHRVVLGRDDVTLGHARVDAEPWSDGEGEGFDGARCRREGALGVLGVEAGLDGVPDRRGRIALQPAAAGDVDLQLDQVDPGRQLGDRVLHLEAGVHLEERELLLGRLVQELDRPCVLVLGCVRQADRGGPQVAILLGRQRDALGLLDHLLVASLHAAVADPDRPHRAVGVGDELHLDVAGVRHDPLHEHRGVAEGLEPFGPGALEGLVEPMVVVDPPDAAASAARGRLDHQRVADGGGVRACFVERLDGSTAPRRDRHVGALGQQLGFDLVAEPAHDVRAGTDEGDAQPLAQLGELRPLRDEPPAHPRRVGPGCDEGPLQRVEVEVGAGCIGRAPVVDAHRLVGLPHEHRRLLGPRVQGDGADVGAVLVAELPHRVDQPHRGLATVDDGDATKASVHRRRAYLTDCTWLRCALSTGVQC